MTRSRILPALAIAATALAGLPGAASATPTPPPSVTSTTTTSAPSIGSTPLTGLSVSYAETGERLVVTVSTDLGELSLPQHGDLTLSYGQSWSGSPSISFTGTAADADAALGAATFSPLGHLGETAHVKVSAMVDPEGFVYGPTTGHLYQYVAAQGDVWTHARSEALTRSFQGVSGYLASIPDSDVNQLIAAEVIPQPLGDNIDVYMGAHAVNTPGDPVQRTWSWTDGPRDGQVFSQCTNATGPCDFSPSTGLFSAWSTDEPNNDGTGEVVGITNYAGWGGIWNDAGQTDTTYNAGYVVEYGDQLVGGSFATLATATSSVDVVVPRPFAPGNVAVTPGDRRLTVSFDQFSYGDGVPTSYQVSLDGGHTWRSTKVTGAAPAYGRRVCFRGCGTTVHTAVVEPVRNGASYAVRLRGVNASGHGPASTSVRTSTQQWFHDPLTPAQRASLAALPHGLHDGGPLRRTVATLTASNGTPAMRAMSLHGRRLQSGQAATVDATSFHFLTARLTSDGLDRVRAIAASLGFVTAITCEGYADYGPPDAKETTLAAARAQAVCRALVARGAHVTTSVRGLGGSRPTVIGGTRSDRKANRRVVVLATRG